MKKILFSKLLGDPTIRGDEVNGFKILRGQKELDGGKDVIAHCDTLQEAKELVIQLKELEK